MRHDDEAHVGQALAFLSAAGKSDELIGNDGYRRNTHFFKIALVNYQP